MFSPIFSCETMQTVDNALGNALHIETSSGEEEKQEFTYYIQSATYTSLSASLTISLIRSKKSVESLSTPCNFSLSTKLCIQGETQNITAFSPTEHPDIQRHYNNAVVIFQLHTLVEEGDKQTLQKVEVYHFDHGLTLRSKNFLGFCTLVEPDRSKTDPVRDSLFSRNVFKAKLENGRVTVRLETLSPGDAYIFAEDFPTLAFYPDQMDKREAKHIYHTLFIGATRADLYYYPSVFEKL